MHDRFRTTPAVSGRMPASEPRLRARGPRCFCAPASPPRPVAEAACMLPHAARRDGTRKRLTVLDAMVETSTPWGRSLHAT